MWNAMSSIITVVPSGRVPPTDGKMPERIAQYFEYSSGLSVKLAGTYNLNGAMSAFICSMLASSSSLESALVSVSTAVNPSPVVSLTDESDFLSSISALNTGPGFIATTASHASFMLEK